MRYVKQHEMVRSMQKIRNAKGRVRRPEGIGRVRVRGMWMSMGASIVSFRAQNAACVRAREVEDLSRMERRGSGGRGVRVVREVRQMDQTAGG